MFLYFLSIFYSEHPAVLRPPGVDLWHAADADSPLRGHGSFQQVFPDREAEAWAGDGCESGTGLESHACGSGGSAAGALRLRTAGMVGIHGTSTDI